MIRKQIEPSTHQPVSAPSPGMQPHPAWCDPARCTADPASQADGFRAGIGGEHRSAPIRLSLTRAMWLQVREGTAWLSQACAPWECEVFLDIQIGDTELSVPVGYAAPVLGALAGLAEIGGGAA